MCLCSFVCSLRACTTFEQGGSGGSIGGAAPIIIACIVGAFIGEYLANKGMGWVL